VNAEAEVVEKKLFCVFQKSVEAVKAPLKKAADIVKKMLEEDQKTLFARAKKMQEAKTVEPKNYDDSPSTRN
jgi:DNA relaxase NicK